jgi:NTP pyrophosphatase (non-canonical NTP hydrolase)
VSRFLFILFIGPELPIFGTFQNSLDHIKMDIHELTEAMNNFVASKGWHEAGSKRPQTPRNLAISISLEAAEILEHFQWRDEPANKDEFAGELADVTLYLLQLASVSGIDLEQAVMNKLKFNATRTWDNS